MQRICVFLSHQITIYMQLIEIHYKDENWELKDFFLQETNLIVGKNASGKSRTLQLISDLAQCILKNKPYLGTNVELFNVSWKDKDGGIWTHEIQRVEFIFESFKMVWRYNSEEISSISSSSFDGLNMNNLSHRFPSISKIYTWAQNIAAFKFANILPQNNLTNLNTDKLTTISEVKLMLDNLPLSSFEKIKQEIISVGYELEDFKIRGGSLYIKTPNIKRDLSLEEISQGMFRTLMLLMYWEYLATNQSVSAFLIDDLCEGLDFERAKKLGKLLFEKAKERDIQLIASSNDTFLMEVVGLEAFQVLLKEGNTVQSINSTSQPKIFDDFEYIGSTNFDLFSSNFIQNKLKA